MTVVSLRDDLILFALRAKETFSFGEAKTIQIGGEATQSPFTISY